MTRRLLNLLTVLSLLLFVASLSLWLRSYLRSDYCVRFRAHRPALGASSCRGLLVLTAYPNIPSEPPGFRWGSDDGGWTPEHPPANAAERLGFWRINRQTTLGPLRHWTLPLSSLVFIAALLPGWRAACWRRRRQQRRRTKGGLCPSCAYNLTGNVSGVCPECGAQANQ